MTRKLYYIVEDRSKHKPVIVSSIETSHERAVKMLTTFKQENVIKGTIPLSSFFVSWQWDTLDGRKELSKMGVLYHG